MEANEYQKMFDYENDYWWYRLLHELVRHYVKGAPGGRERRIFDAGCGTGRALECLADLGQVLGVDYSAQAIELCKRRGLMQVSIADLNTWKGEPDSFDVAISLDVLCTEGIIDDSAVLRQLHRALKPGGRLILNMPAFELLRRPHDVAVSTLRRFNRRQTIKQLQNLGFDIERAGYRLPLLFLFILARKIFAGHQDGPVESDLHPLPKWVNGLLLWVHRLENRLFGWHLSWPLGSSLFIVCRKRS